MFIAPFLEIKTLQVAATEITQPIIRNAVIRQAADQYGIVLTVKCSFYILAPLVKNNFRREADFLPISLNHLRHQPRIWIVGPLYRRRPERKSKTIRITGPRQ